MSKKTILALIIGGLIFIGVSSSTARASGFWSEVLSESGISGQRGVWSYLQSTWSQSSSDNSWKIKINKLFANTCELEKINYIENKYLKETYLNWKKLYQNPQTTIYRQENEEIVKRLILRETTPEKIRKLLPGYAAESGDYCDEGKGVYCTPAEALTTDTDPKQLYSEMIKARSNLIKSYQVYRQEKPEENLASNPEALIIHLPLNDEDISDTGFSDLDELVYDATNDENADIYYKHLRENILIPYYQTSSRFFERHASNVKIELKKSKDETACSEVPNWKNIDYPAGDCKCDNYGSSWPTLRSANLALQKFIKSSKKYGKKQADSFRKLGEYAVGKKVKENQIDEEDCTEAEIRNDECDIVENGQALTLQNKKGQMIYRNQDGKLRTVPQSTLDAARSFGIDYRSRLSHEQDGWWEKTKDKFMNIDTGIIRNGQRFKSLQEIASEMAKRDKPISSSELQNLAAAEEARLAKLREDIKKQLIKEAFDGIEDKASQDICNKFNQLENISKLTCPSS